MKIFHNKYIKFILFTLLILQISNVTSVPTSYILGVTLVMFFVVGLSNNIRPSNNVIFIFAIWLVINALFVFVYNSQLKMNVLVFGSIMIILPYYFHKIYGLYFWVYLEKYIFILTALSIPLFVANVLFSSQFDALDSIFKPFTRDVFDTIDSYWSAGFYTNSLQTYGLNRNCGFMWEPGYFATVIIVFMIINWLIYGIRLDLRILIYSIALITTLSTSGFMALFILYILYFIKRLRWQYVVIVLPIFISMFIYIYSVSVFMSGKIENYMSAVETNRSNYSEVYDAVKLNRVQIFIFDLKRVVKYPLGFGSNTRLNFGDIDTTGTNGISGMFIMWGIPMFVLWIYLMFKFFKGLNLRDNDRVTFLFCVTAFCCVWFSQNLHLNILLYLILISPLVISPKQIICLRKQRIQRSL